MGVSLGVELMKMWNNLIEFSEVIDSRLGMLDFVPNFASIGVCEWMWSGDVHGYYSEIYFVLLEFVGG